MFKILVWKALRALTEVGEQEPRHSVERELVGRIVPAEGVTILGFSIRHLFVAPTRKRGVRSSVRMSASHIFRRFRASRNCNTPSP